MHKKFDKKKVVTFQLVDRSLEDPLSRDPNAPQKVLVPIYIGSDVKQDTVDFYAKQMQPEERSIADMPKYTKQGIGAQYNKYFGVDADDGTDYSKYFKPIDEENDEGVFVAPDGSIHDLKKREISDVDLLVQKFGMDRELFGTEIDPTLPKLVDDTEDLLNGDIDPDILAAMDDEDVEPLDDDFFAKALALENEKFDDEEEDEFEKKSGAKKTFAKSRASHLSHASHISHRSEAMDYVEEKVEILLNTVYNSEEEDIEEDNEPHAEIDWDDVLDDFEQVTNPLKKIEALSSNSENRINPNLVLPDDDDDVEEEEEKNEPKEKWDAQSIIETYSTTENRPTVIRDENIPAKKKKQPKKEEPEENDEDIIPPEMQPKEGETKEEAKARKKAIKEYNRQRRMAKKETKQKFAKATKKVKKSIAASGASRGRTVIPLD